MANLVLNEAERSADVGFVTKSVLLPQKKVPATLKMSQRKPSSLSARKPCLLILRKRKDEAASLLLKKPFYRFYLSAEERAISPLDSQQDRKKSSKKRRTANFFKPTERIESNKSKLSTLRNFTYLKTEKQVELNFPSSSLDALKWLLSKRHSSSTPVDELTPRTVKDSKSFDGPVVEEKQKPFVNIPRVDRDSANSLPATYCNETRPMALRKKTLTRTPRRDVRAKATSCRKSEDVERIFTMNNQTNELAICSKETLKETFLATTIRSSIDLTTDICKLPATFIPDLRESTDTTSKRSYLQLIENEETRYPGEIRQNEKARVCKTKYSWQTIGKAAQTSRTLIDESTKSSGQHSDDRWEDRFDDSRYECTIKYSWQIVGTGTQTSVHDYIDNHVEPTSSYRILGASLRNRDAKRSNDPIKPLTVRRNGKFYLVLTERGAQTTADKENQADFVRICMER